MVYVEIKNAPIHLASGSFFGWLPMSSHPFTISKGWDSCSTNVALLQKLGIPCFFFHQIKNPIETNISTIPQPNQGFFFHFPWSVKVAILYVTMVLQISTFIYILDRKYHISTYHISIILFSSTIWRFHPRFFLNLKFFGNFIQNFTIFFL